ncbi:alpha-galactosidase, partial [Aeromonas caviae]|nr:alpha-galactosidase [Aeromonas caviae]
AARTPAARFEGMAFERGRVALPEGGELLCLFNWGEHACEFPLTPGGTDFWDETPLGSTLVLQGGQGAVIRYP